ncbi:MAG: NPCBM/NEW2 domain-containing protein [Bifidobacteriaceae bacterium]|jgi:hypothetical protein|nr:NPCBM/NEW2 domain-containing protein [Bifidobacteriaceae bacterium]
MTKVSVGTRIGVVRALIGASALVGLVVAGVAAPAEAARAKPKAVVTISVRAAADRGTTVTVSGKVKSSTTRKVIGKAKVAVQYRVPGGKWRTLATVKSTKAGKFSVKTVLAETREFRAKVLSTKKYRAGVSKVKTTTARVVVVPQSLAAAPATPDVLDVGGNVTVTGSASPGLIGTPVHLQVQSGQEWGTIASATVAPDASFAIGAAVNTAGRGQQLRVYAPGDAANGIGDATAPAGAVTVYMWYPVWAVGEITSDYAASGTEMLNGTPYEESLTFCGSERCNRGGVTGSATYNLDRKCTTFRASPGIRTSASSTNGSVRLRVWREDSEVPLKGNTGTYYAPGHVEVPVDNVLRFAITLDQVPGHEGALGNLVLGTPQVRCAFDPTTP